MGRYCEHCGKPMSEGAAFCPSCGRPVAAPAADGEAAPENTHPAGLPSHLAAALAYLWITAIVFLLLDPYNRDRLVRFHAFQALFLGLVSIAGHIVLSLIPILGWILLPFWSLVIVVFALIAAVKAYQGETWNVPVIGPFAQKHV
jgi:uncharacterized membrane protein